MQASFLSSASSDSPHPQYHPLFSSSFTPLVYHTRKNVTICNSIHFLPKIFSCILKKTVQIPSSPNTTKRGMPVIQCKKKACTCPLDRYTLANSLYSLLSLLVPSSSASSRASTSSGVLEGAKLMRKALSMRSCPSCIAASTWLALPLAQAEPEET